MSDDERPLPGWTPRRDPEPVVLEGIWCRLEPLGPQHAEALFAASMAGDPREADARFRFLFETPPSRAAFDCWLAQVAGRPDPRFFAVVDRATGRAEGRQALMRTVPEFGVTEVGSILWGPAITRTRIATEALFLFAQYVFDELGYRRLEWKCDSRNAPSRRAAARFGFSFEGIFRQHMVVKGMNRDTAWFALTDGEWARIAPGYRRWLAPANFDADWGQLSALAVRTAPSLSAAASGPTSGS